MSIGLYSDSYIGPIASGKGWTDLCAQVGPDDGELGKFCEDGFSEQPEALRKSVLDFIAQKPETWKFGFADVVSTLQNLATMLEKVEGIAIASDSLVVEDEEPEEAKKFEVYFKPEVNPVAGGPSYEMSLLKALTDLLEKPVLAIDFDGTFVKPDPDNPTAVGPFLDGAIDALAELSKEFDIVIFTARTDFAPVWAALQQNNASAFVTDVSNIKSQNAVEFLDDRGQTFPGVWSRPLIESIRSFAPYWKMNGGTRELLISATDLNRIENCRNCGQPATLTKGMCHLCKAPRPAPKLDPAYSHPDLTASQVQLREILQHVFRNQRERAKEKAGRLLKVRQEVIRAWIDEGLGKLAQRISATVGIRKPEDKGPQGGRTEVQSLIFMPKDAWTKEQVRDWLKDHDYKTTVEETESSYRARQEDPDKYDRIRTIPFKDGKAQGFDLAKQDDDDEDAVNIADEIYDALRELFGEIPIAGTEPLQRAALAGVNKGLAEIEIDADMIAPLNAGARDWASNRAAEMVGMKKLPDGSLIENPNAKWAISSTTRDDLRRIITTGFTKETPMKDLVNQIGEAGAFSDARATLIANTEVAFSQTNANLSVWKASGVVKKLRWQLSADHDQDDECDEAAEEVVNIGESFPGVEVECPPGHPRCTCAAIAVFD